MSAKVRHLFVSAFYGHSRDNTETPDKIQIHPILQAVDIRFYCILNVS